MKNEFRKLVTSPGAVFPTLVTSCSELARPLKRRRDADEDPHVLATRYFYNPPLGFPFNHCTLSFINVVIELLIKCFWYRLLAGIKRTLFGTAFPDAPTTGSSPANRIPQGIVDMIIAHLIDDTQSLRECSFISRSWYSAAVPHLHRTIIAKRRYRSYDVIEWSESLLVASKFGFLPFVTRVFISGRYRLDSVFSVRELDYRTQRNFSELINVREFSIDMLYIPDFIPRIQEHFGQFSPTLRSLTLTSPAGSGRQVVYFIGLFPHLEDLELRDQWYSPGNKEGGLGLIPSFVPPLRGRLTAHCPVNGFGKAVLDMFGEILCRHMDLREGGIQYLLYACPNTLETLRLDATNICGEKFSLKGTKALADNFTGRFCRDLDLSRNRSLRKLEITASSIMGVMGVRAPTAIPSSFKTMISSIKSPVFSDVVVIYQQGDFYNDLYPAHTSTNEESRYHRQFKVLREMHKARDYRLVLSASCVGDDSVRELKRAVAVERAKGGLPSQIAVEYTLRAY